MHVTCGASCLHAWCAVGGPCCALKMPRAGSLPGLALPGKAPGQRGAVPTTPCCPCPRSRPDGHAPHQRRRHQRRRLAMRLPSRAASTMCGREGAETGRAGAQKAEEEALPLARTHTCSRARRQALQLAEGVERVCAAARGVAKVQVQERQPAGNRTEQSDRTAGKTVMGGVAGRLPAGQALWGASLKLHPKQNSKPRSPVRRRTC